MPNMTHACFYCNYNRYVPNTCYMKRFGETSDKYVWVEKEYNQKGSKEF